MKKESFVVVHCWLPMDGGKTYINSGGAAINNGLGKNQSHVGHVAISLHDVSVGGSHVYEYYSFWPTVDFPGLNAVPGLFVDFEIDLSSKGENRKPDAQIIFYSLNNIAIRNHINALKKKLSLNNLKWCVSCELADYPNHDVTQNCSSLSWNLLLSGGLKSICNVETSRSGPKDPLLRKKYKCDEGSILGGLFDDAFWRDWFVSPKYILHLASAAKERELALYPATLSYDGDAEKWVSSITTTAINNSFAKAAAFSIQNNFEIAEIIEPVELIKTKPLIIEPGKYVKPAQDIQIDTFDIDNGLTWKDWFYLAQNNIAIRHHNDKSNADAEQLKGCNEGDACSLVIPYLNMPNAFHLLEISDIKATQKWFINTLNEIERRFNEIKNGRKDIFNNSVNLSRIEKQIKELEVNLMQNSLHNCKTNLTNIYNIMLYDWICQCFKYKYIHGNINAFLLINIEFFPYDFSNYPLGKIGKRRFLSSDVLMQVFQHDKNWSADIAFLTIAEAIRKFHSGEFKNISPLIINATPFKVTDQVGSSVKSTNLAQSDTENKKTSLLEEDILADTPYVVTNTTPATLNEHIKLIRANNPQKNRVFLDYASKSQQLTEIHIAELTEALKDNTVVSELSFYSQKFGANVAYLLASMLKVNKRILSIDLSDNLIGAEGASYLANALINNNTLHTLLLRSNNISDSGMIHLAKSLSLNITLSYLYLMNNNIGSTGVNELANELTKASATTNRFSHMYNSLYSLDLSQNPIGDSGAKSIAIIITSNCNLGNLGLHSCNISDEGAIAIARGLKNNSHLTMLTISCNKFTLAAEKVFEDALADNYTLISIIGLSGDRYLSGGNGGHDAPLYVKYLQRNLTLKEQYIHAININNLDQIKQLLNKGVSPIINCHKSLIALYTASINRHHELIKYIISRGALRDMKVIFDNPNIRNDWKDRYEEIITFLRFCLSETSKTFFGSTQLFFQGSTRANPQSNLNTPLNPQRFTP